MANQQLVDYIKQRLAQGASEADIRQALVSSGWQNADIDEALNVAKTQGTVPPVPGGGALLGVVETFKEALGLYKSRIKTFLGIAIIPVAVTFAVILVVVAILFLMGSFGGPANPIRPMTFIDNAFANIGLGNGLGIALILVIIIAAIGLIILFAWAQAALITAIKDSAEGIGIKESYRRAKAKIASFIWVSFLVGIVTMGGFILLIVPGIIFAVWFSFAVFVVMTEDIKGFAALSKSKEYVKGFWWSVFGRLLFAALISFAISIGTAILGFILSLVFGNLGEILSSIINNIANFVIAPLILTYQYLVYKNLKAVKGVGVSQAAAGESKTLLIIMALVGVLVIPGILGTIVLVSLNTAREKAKEAAVNAALAQTRAVAEMIYSRDNESYQKLCKNNRLNIGDDGVPSYGSQIKSVADRIIQNSYDGSGELCNVSGQKDYCVSAVLEPDATRSLCVDASGYVGKGVCETAGKCEQVFPIPQKGYQLD